jgi:hypothetical protein
MAFFAAFLPFEAERLLQLKPGIEHQNVNDDGRVY